MGYYVTPDECCDDEDFKAAASEIVKTICHYCDKPIGWGSKYYLIGKPGAWSAVHMVCELTAIEDEHRQL